MRRFVSIPMVWAVLAAAVLVTGLLAAWQAPAVRADPALRAAVSLGDGALGEAVFLQAVAIVLGAFVAGADLTSPRLARVWLATPGRAQGVLMQAVIACAAGTAAGMLGITAAGLGWVVAGGPVRIAGDDLTRCIGAVVWLSLLAVLAHAVTVALRSLVGGIGALVLLMFVVEPQLYFLSHAFAWLPGLAGRQLFLVVDGESNVAGLLPGASGGAIACAWVAAALAVAVVSARRRDVG